MFFIGLGGSSFRSELPRLSRSEREREPTAESPPLMTIGDFWLLDYNGWSDLASSLRELGYSFVGGKLAASPGMRLAQMAKDKYLDDVKGFLRESRRLIRRKRC